MVESLRRLHSSANLRRIVDFNLSFLLLIELLLCCLSSNELLLYLHKRLICQNIIVWQWNFNFFLVSEHSLPCLLYLTLNLQMIWKSFKASYFVFIFDRRLLILLRNNLHQSCLVLKQIFVLTRRLGSRNYLLPMH